MSLLLAMAGGFSARVAPAHAGLEREVKIRALLVAINHYQHGEGWPELYGPLRDLKEIRGALIERFHADPRRITVLPESQATRSGIENALKNLVESSLPGETVVFYYAGHGSVVPDLTGTDLDGLNECIVPVDTPPYNKPGYEDAVVRDKFIADQLAAAVRRVRPDESSSGSVVFVFDSCHSGGMSRAPAGKKRVRSVRGVRDYFFRKMGRNPVNKPLIATPHQAGPHGWVVVAACSSEQEAQDSPSFTHRLVAALGRGELTARSDYNDLLQLIGRDDTQTPQVDGDRQLPVLGGTAEPRTPAIQVMSVEKAGSSFRLHLDEGSLLGVNKGSKLAVYRFGTRARSEKQNYLGEGVVVETDETTPYSAVASIKGRSEKELIHAVAWMSDQAVGLSRKVRVAFGADFPADGRGTEVRELIRKSFADSASSLALEDSPDIVIFGSSPDGRTGGKITVERNVIPQSVLLSVDAADASAVEKVTDALKNFVRQQAFETFVSNSADVAFKVTPGQFTDPGKLDSFVSADAASLRGRDGWWSFTGKQQVLVEIKNNSNKPLYVSLLTLHPTQGINVLYPSEAEAQGSWKPLPSRGTFMLPLRLKPDDDEPSDGHYESIKVLATSEPIPVHRLVTRSTRSAGDVKGSLARFITTVADGTTRSAEVVKASGPFYVTPSQWFHIAPAREDQPSTSSHSPLTM